jgi:hypothetical protein
MKPRSLAKLLLVAAASLVVAFAAMSIKAPRAQASFDNTDSIVEIGYKIAPVPLNLAGKDHDLVGIGSYLVNAVGDCNGCHSSNAPPLGLYPYNTGQNPYFNQPQQIDPSVYLNGGQNFGSVGTPTGPNGYAGPAIITRNLTPDKTGRAEGGRTLAQFIQIIRTGIDLDQIHPTCTADQLTAIENGATPVCIPTGPIVFGPGPGQSYDNIPDGSLLQVMPWPAFANMSDRDLEAIYQYLSAIPCINNTTSTPPAGAPNELLNDCGTGSVADKSVRDSSGNPGPALHPRR